MDNRAAGGQGHLRGPCVPAQLWLDGVSRPVSVSPFCPCLQKQKKGIVMVNFYNDYVTCQQTAKLSNVAGEPPAVTKQPDRRRRFTAASPHRSL